MAVIFNVQTGKLETVPDSEVSTLVAKGTHQFAAGAEVPVIFADNSRGSIPAEQASQAFATGSARFETAPESVEQEKEQVAEEIYGSAPKAAAQSLLSTAALGLPELGLAAASTLPGDIGEYGKEQLQALEQMRSRSPLASAAGAAAGFLTGPASKAISEGTSAVAKKLLGTEATEIAASTAANATVSAVARKAAQRAAELGLGSAIEGALYSTGQAASELALGRPEDAAETLTSNLILGGVLGGAFGAGSELLPFAAKKITGAIKGLKEKAADRAAKALLTADQYADYQLLKSAGESGLEQATSRTAQAQSKAVEGQINDLLGTAVDAETGLAKQTSKLDRQLFREQQIADKKTTALFEQAEADALKQARREIKRLPDNDQKLADEVFNSVGQDVYQAYTVAKDIRKNAYSRLGDEYQNLIDNGPLLNDTPDVKTLLDKASAQFNKTNLASRTGTTLDSELGYSELTSVPAILQSSKKFIRETIDPELRRLGKFDRQTGKFVWRPTLGGEDLADAQRLLTFREFLDDGVKKYLQASENPVIRAASEMLGEADSVYARSINLERALGNSLKKRLAVSETYDYFPNIAAKVLQKPEEADKLIELIDKFGSVLPNAGELKAGISKAQFQKALADDLAAKAAEIAGPKADPLTVETAQEFLKRQINTLPDNASVKQIQAKVDEIQQSLRSVNERLLEVRPTAAAVSGAPEALSPIDKFLYLNKVLKNDKFYNELLANSQLSMDVVNSAKQQRDLQKAYQNVKEAGDQGQGSVVRQALQSLGLVDAFIPGGRAVTTPLRAIGSVAAPLSATPIEHLQSLIRMEKIANKFNASVDSAIKRIQEPGLKTVKITAQTFSKLKLPEPLDSKDYEEIHAKLDESRATLSQETPLNLKSVLGSDFSKLSPVIKSQALAVVNLLSEAVPKNPYSSYLGSESLPWKPSSSEVARYQRTLGAIREPVKVIDRVAAGIATSDEIKVLQTLYPSVYSKLETKLSELMITGKSPISYQQRIYLHSLFPTVQTHPALDPKNMGMIQGSLTNSVKQDTGNTAGGRPRGSTQLKFTEPESYLTPAQKAGQ